MNTPSSHPDASRLVDYRAGRLEASAALAVSDHLVACPTCREALAGPVPGVFLPPVGPDAPPEYEEIAASLDGTLAPAQQDDLRARLESSPVAAAEYADLARFREESAALPPRLHGPPPVTSRAGSTRVPAPGKVVAFRRSFRAPLAVAAALALCLAGWWTVAHRPAPDPPLWADADLTGLPDALRRDVEQAARTGEVAAPALVGTLRPSVGTLAGAPSSPAGFRQVAPVGVVVREDRPTLRWTPRADAAVYVVYLTDLDGNAPMLRQEVPGDRTEWTPSVPLGRGAVYEWQVEVRRGGEIIDRVPRPPAPETRFQVLAAARATALNRVENRFPQNALILGTAYTQAGLDAAALGQFERLSRDHPRSKIAARLLRMARDRMVPVE